MLAVAKLAETGAQLALLGGWARVFGALRMWSARRTGLRLFLAISLLGLKSREKALRRLEAESGGRRGRGAAPDEEEEATQ